MITPQTVLIGKAIISLSLSGSGRLKYARDTLKRILLLGNSIFLDIP